MKPFLAISPPAPPQTQSARRLKPMDGDGYIDLLMAGQASQNVVWYENL